jgi:hypothetical protein
LNKTLWIIEIDDIDVVEIDDIKKKNWELGVENQKINKSIVPPSYATQVLFMV